jgi:hypothetical protein
MMTVNLIVYSVTLNHISKAFGMVYMLITLHGEQIPHTMDIHVSFTSTFCLIHIYLAIVFAKVEFKINVFTIYAIFGMKKSLKIPKR